MPVNMLYARGMRGSGRVQLVQLALQCQKSTQPQAHAWSCTRGREVGRGPQTPSTFHAGLGQAFESGTAVNAKQRSIVSSTFDLLAAAYAYA